jgi:hypothetical protein
MTDRREAHLSQGLRTVSWDPVGYLKQKIHEYREGSFELWDNNLNKKRIDLWLKISSQRGC